MFCSRRVLALVALAALGCDHKESAAPKNAPPPGMPPLEGVPAAPAAASDKPEHPPMNAQALPAGHPALPPGHPGMDKMAPAGEPAGIDPQATTPGNIEFDPKSVVTGALRLDDKVKSKVKEGDTIFLTARAFDPSGAQGPILAVKKLTAGKWPMAFQLDARDAMMTGTKLSGKIVVTVRVDKDGDAITKNPGDVSGVSRALDVPSEKVVVTLDTVLQ